MKAHLIAASAAWMALAALAGPVRAENNFDHVHVSAPEPAKAAEWYLRVIGGRKLEQADRIAFGKTLIIFVQRQGVALGSEGSGIDHIGISVPDLAEKMKALRANGVKIVAEPRALPGLYKSAFIEDPWGAKIEILEDPEALGFHHVHLRSPDPAAVLQWYTDVFGGRKMRHKGSVDALQYGDVLLLVDNSRGAAVAPTVGRALDHIGLSVPDMDVAAAELKAAGVKFTQEPAPFRDPKMAIKIAFIEGPDAVKIEIVQRPARWPVWETADNANASEDVFQEGPLAVRTTPHVQTGSADFQVNTVSARNDMISGGDVVVQINVAPRVQPERVAVRLNGVDITTIFRLTAGTQSLLGLVTGLKRGDNTLDVASGDAKTVLLLTNWPLEGPIFAGPHEKPYVCMTQLFKLPVTGGDLGAPLDENCSIANRVDYVYRSSTTNDFKPLPNPTERPADLARTTTSDRREVAYIVRVETGTANRAIYQIAMLHDPASGQAADLWTRSTGWNGRLIYTFGGGCPGGWYQQGRNTAGVLDDPMLSQGFAVVSSSKNVFGNNCDDLLAAETVMLVKEKFIEMHGAPAHTIGWGCSGGSDQVHQIADNYPGLLDGIVPACSFPDIPFAHTTTHSFGARMLHNYFNVTAAEKWTKEQQVAVMGFPSYETLVAQATRPDRLNPRGACDATIPVTLLYDPATNARGTRCTTYDHGVSAWGRDPATGFARRPLDNVGVQYGLTTLNAGVITKAQFLDLNEKIGGVDIDAKFTPARTVGDRIAIRRGYETGRFLSGGGGLAATPIIDYRAYADYQKGDPHMRFHGFSTRHRLREANGHIDNHVMLVEDYTYGGFSTKSPLVREALRQMDQWLLNIAKDQSNAPRTQKVVRAKPVDLVDMCLTPDGRRIKEPQTYDGRSECNKHFPAHSSAYVVAGMPVANNIVLCQKKPVGASDYAVPPTSAELDRLRRMFPEGVCDYSKPGIEQRPLMGTWLSFGPAGKQATQRAAND